MRPSPARRRREPWGAPRGDDRVGSAPRRPGGAAARSAGMVEGSERTHDYRFGVTAQLLSRGRLLSSWKVHLFHAVAPEGDVGLVTFDGPADSVGNFALR